MSEPLVKYHCIAASYLRMYRDAGTQESAIGLACALKEGGASVHVAGRYTQGNKKEEEG
jgi:hypothetical protein